MIKNLTLAFFILIGGVANAQNTTNSGDSTQVKPNLPVVAVDTVKAPTDSIPPVQKPVVTPTDPAQTGQTPANVNQNNSNNTVNTQNNAPKIIYYQSVDDDDNWGKSKTKIRRRGRHRQIHTLTGQNSHSGGFGALSFKSTELRDESIVMAGLRGGWIINRTLGIGFEGYGIIPTASFNIGTEDVMPIGGYGGMFLELIFFSNQVIHVTFPVSGGAGWMGYYEDDSSNLASLDGDKIGDDVFWYVEPGVDLEVNIARNFRSAGGVSRRFTQDLVLPGTEADDFDTFSYFLTLKIGSF